MGIIVFHWLSHGHTLLDDMEAMCASQLKSYRIMIYIHLREVSHMQDWHNYQDVFSFVERNHGG